MVAGRVTAVTVLPAGCIFWGDSPEDQTVSPRLWPSAVADDRRLSRRPRSVTVPGELSSQHLYSQPGRGCTARCVTGLRHAPGAHHRRSARRQYSRHSMAGARGTGRSACWARDVAGAAGSSDRAVVRSPRNPRATVADRVFTPGGDHQRVVGGERQVAEQPLRGLEFTDGDQPGGDQCRADLVEVGPAAAPPPTSRRDRSPAQAAGQPGRPGGVGAGCQSRGLLRVALAGCDCGAVGKQRVARAAGYRAPWLTGGSCRPAADQPDGRGDEQH
jgi:hypothetical protein